VTQIKQGFFFGFDKSDFLFKVVEIGPFRRQVSKIEDELGSESWTRTRIIGGDVRMFSRGSLVLIMSGC